MYSISICDRQSAFCDNLKKYLEEVLGKLDIKCEIAIWNKQEDFMKYLTKKNKIDLLFLEIDVNEAYNTKILRKLEYYCINIIYMSYDKIKVMEYYNLPPEDFIIKPVAKEQLENNLKRFIFDKKNNKGKILFKENYKYVNMEYDSIYYFRSENHKVLVYSKEGRNEFYGKLSEVEMEVPNNFIRIHKSYLVNIHYIKKFNYESVIMDNDIELPISKAYRSTIRKFAKETLKKMSFYNAERLQLNV